MLSSVTRLPGGINNVAETAGLADFKIPNPLTYNMMYDDFDKFTAGDWTATGTGSVALQASTDGGVIAMLTAAGSTNEESMQFGAPNLTFTPDVTKDLFFAARVNLDDVTNGGLFFGLSVTDTSPLVSAPTDGMYFRKLVGSTTGKFTVRVGSANTYDIDLPTALSATWYELVAAYTAQDGVWRGFVNGAGFRIATNPTALTMGAVPMALTFSVLSGTNPARTLLIDNYLVAKGR